MARLDHMAQEAQANFTAYRYDAATDQAFDLIDECRRMLARPEVKKQPQLSAQLWDRVLQGVEISQRPLLEQGYGERVSFAAQRWLDLAIEEIGPRYFCLGRMYRLLGDEAALRADTAAAIAWYGKGRQLAFAPNGDAAQVMADLHDALALVWAGRRDFRQAFLELELADQLTRRHLGDRHLVMSDRWFHYAEVCSLQGDYKTAHDYYEKALKQQEKVLGEGALRNIPILMAWGRLWMRQQQALSAERQFERAAQLSAAAPAGFAPVALELHSLRLELARQRYDYRQALQHADRAYAVAGCRRDSVRLRNSLHGLRVELWRGHHRYAEALQSLSEWEKFRRSSFLDDTLALLDIRLAQAEMLTLLGRYGAANPYFRHVSAWYAEKCPSDGQRQWAVAQARIRWALDQSRTTEALQLLSASVDGVATRPCDRARWAALHAEWSEKSGRLSDWLESSRYGLAEALAGDCADEQLLLYESLGRAELRSGDMSAGLPLLQHVLMSREQTNERYHPQTLRVYMALCDAHLREGDPVQALAALQEGRRVALAVYGSRHVTAADLLVLEAQAVRAQGRPDQFMDLAVDAWAFYDRLPPLPSPYRTRLNLLLTEWYASKGQLERADRYLGYALRSPGGIEEFQRYMADPRRAYLLNVVRVLGLSRAFAPADASGRKRSMR